MATSRRLFRAVSEWWVSVLLTTLAGTLLIPTPAPAGRGQASFDLLLVGDSITNGTPAPGFRSALRSLLDGAPDTYTFLGSSGNPPSQGHFLSGARIQQFYPDSFGNGWGDGSFDVTPDLGPPTPNIAIVHLGTNDINSDTPPLVPYSNDNGATLEATCSGELAELIKYLEQWADGTQSSALDAIVLSRIIPIENHQVECRDFNEEIIALSHDFAEGAATGSPLRVAIADHYGRFLANPDLFTGNSGDWMDADGIHPNTDGYMQMADLYYDAILEATTDATSPALVADLSIASVGDQNVVLTWTASGDDGAAGTARYYDLRLANQPLNASNFAAAPHATGEPAPATASTVESLDVVALDEGETYYFALKVVDDAGNRSVISNVVAATPGAGTELVDDFERPGPELGPNWVADAEYAIVSGELANTGTDPLSIDYIAAFTAAGNPVGAGYRWAATTVPDARNQAGFALRLDAPSPDAAGYLIYRNEPAAGHPNAWVLRQIVAGDIGPEVTNQTSTMATPPAGGDLVRCIMSSDAGGHHFDMFVNGVFDTRLTDAGKTQGNADPHYAGYMSRAAMDNNIDDFTVVTALGPNTPPSAFALSMPADQSQVPTPTPSFDWGDALDIDPGDSVTYTLQIADDPGFPRGTQAIGGLSESAHTLTAPLDRGVTYFWRVIAEDQAGAQTFSNQTFSFDVPNLRTVIDMFERATLGTSWVHDPARYGIEAGELANIDPVGQFSLVVYGERANPVIVGFDLGAQAMPAGFDAKAGFALMLDAPSTSASGYMLYRNYPPPFDNWQLITLVGGGIGSQIGGAGNPAATLPAPVAGDEVQVILSSDDDGHHFDIFVNGAFDARASDPNKLQGQNPDLYAGYFAAGGGLPNHVDNFTLAGEGFNAGPLPFDLAGPADGATVEELSPLLSWEAAVDPNPDDTLTYVVWYDTDPAFGSPDSLVPTVDLQTPFTGEIVVATPIHWRVRAYDLDGAAVWSAETRSFEMTQVLSVADDFNRPGPDLGPDWAADSVMQIVANELSNTSSSGLGIAAFSRALNPDGVEIRWGAGANAEGIRRGGVALKLDDLSPTASGYLVRVDPVANESQLETIQQGGHGQFLDSAPGMVAGPTPGSTMRVTMRSDGQGLHFDVIIDGALHSSLLAATGVLLAGGGDEYAGVALRGGNQNNVDQFTAFASGMSPVALSRFTASGEPSRVVVEWQSSSERNHRGYHLWRAGEALPLEFERLTERYVEAETPHFYRFVDESVEVGIAYAYRLEAVATSGAREFFGPVWANAVSVPVQLVLHQNAPNPFNPATRIRYDLPAAAHVRVAVFDAQGRLVRQLVDAPVAAGSHFVDWLGTNDQGKALGSGTFFYRLETGPRTLTRKMLLVR